MVALASTTLSFWPFLVTETESFGTTATIENSAPDGFQHLVQPHIWLCALWDFTVTSTGSLEHLQVSVPPLKLDEPFLMPPSTDG
jgi:hypothetical protein